jgi:sec-independent protein translocase protein TatC
MESGQHLEPYQDDEAPPLLDALEKVRWRLFRIAISLFLGVVAGFGVAHYTRVTELLVHPVRPFLDHQDGRLAALSPITPFMLELKVGLVIGILISLPVILYQVWGHVSPILQPAERRLILPGLWASILLFALGLYVGWLALPISLDWLFKFQADYVTAVVNADDYFSFATRLLLAFGIVFEMPIVFMILTTLGLVTPRWLRRMRRHAVVIIAVLSALITPGDVASMFLMMVPMVVLYEVSILASQLIYRRHQEPEDDSSEGEAAGESEEQVAEASS